LLREPFTSFFLNFFILSHFVQVLSLKRVLLRCHKFFRSWKSCNRIVLLLFNFIVILILLFI
jgi:hypothetical protein